MKRSLCILLLLCSLRCYGAAGDFVSCVVRADGWSVDIAYAGMDTNGTFSTGLGTNNILYGAQKVVLNVTSQGYSSAGTLITNSRTVIGTKFVRFAYPNDAFPDQVLSNPLFILGNVTNRIALSYPIYITDSNVTVTVLSGLYTKTIASSSSSVNVAVVNNSTNTYPVIFGQWDTVAGVRTADRVGASVPVAFDARHGFGIAAVRFDATGLTSGATATTTVTTESQIRRANGQYHASYAGTLTLSGFTTGESVELRARCYPLVGNQILDTDSFTTATDEVLGHNKATVKYLSTIKYAYVSTSGNDGTGVASTTQATAAANPFLSIGKAVQNDATVIYLLAGTHPPVRNAPTSRRTTAEWYVVQPAPGQDRTTVTVQLDSTRTYMCQRMQFSGVTVTLFDTSSWLDGEEVGNFIRFNDCTFNHGSIGIPTVGPGYRSYACYMENCLGDLGVSTWSIQDFSSTRHAYQFDGCQFIQYLDSAGNSMGPWFRVVACTMSGTVSFVTHSTSNIAPIQDAVIFDDNRFRNHLNFSFLLSLCDTVQVQITNGVSVCGNVVEFTGNNGVFKIASDDSAVICNHVIARNNTTSGGRWNFGYNDAGTTAYDRRNWFVENNIWESLATKSDTFNKPGPGPSGSRIGNWPVIYGVGWNGNISSVVGNIGAGGSFLFEFIGLNGYQPLGITGQPPAVSTTTNAPGFLLFVDRQSYNGVTTGQSNGVYRVRSDSPAVLLHSEGIYRRPFDQSGNATGGFDPSGAYSSASPRKGGGFF